MITSIPFVKDVLPLAVRAAVEVKSVIGRLVRGEYGEQAMPIPDVLVAVKNGSSEGWTRAADDAETLRGGHEQASADAAELAGILAGGAWRGTAAELATRRVRAMAAVAEIAAVSYKSNSENLHEVAGAFDRLKASVEEMPERPPNKSLWDLVTPWKTDTEVAITQYNNAAQQNLQRYNEYARLAENAAQRLRVDYGHVETFDEPAPSPVPPPGGGGGRIPDHLGHTGVSSFGGPAPVAAAPPWAHQPSAPPSWQAGGPVMVPPVHGGTTPSAVAARAPGFPSGATPRTGAGGPGPAGGFAAAPFAGGGARNGPGGQSGAGQQRPVQGRPGAGGFGPGVPGGQAAGGRGGGGMAPVGVGGSRSRGEDDGEHRDELTKADESLFRPDPKAVDPVTGMRVIDSGSIGG